MPDNRPGPGLDKIGGHASEKAEHSALLHRIRWQEHCSLRSFFWYVVSRKALALLLHNQLSGCAKGKKGSLCYFPTDSSFKGSSTAHFLHYKVDRILP